PCWEIGGQKLSSVIPMVSLFSGAFLPRAYSDLWFQLGGGSRNTEDSPPARAVSDPTGRAGTKPRPYRGGSSGSGPLVILNRTAAAGYQASVKLNDKRKGW